MSDNNKEKEELEVIKGQLKGICFFVTSTFGNGTHPTSAASLAEWLDAKLNDSEDNVYERLNTMIQTQLPGISEILPHHPSKTDRTPIEDGQVPPLVRKKSAMKLGRLTSKNPILDQGKQKASKTLSRRISMATINVTPTNSEFSKLR